MKRAKLVKMMVAAMSLTLLTACNIIPEGEEGGESTSSEDQVIEEDKAIQQLGEAQYYQPLIDQDGNYPVSQNRGTTSRLNSNINMKLFEDDLIRLAQDYFPVEDHYFQEGQYISSDMVQTWLDRESEDNPEGLNPRDEAQPRYLNSVLEHDFYQVNEDGNYQLAGMSIGLAMNPEDSETDTDQEIDRQTLIDQGQEMADKIVAKVREHEDIGDDLPIMVGIFEQAAKDDLSGGTYIQKGLSQGGPDVAGWEEVDEERLVFPVQGGESPEVNSFKNFQSQVESFFPNLNGVVGRAHYINEILADLHIQITTQFYGRGEMAAFTYYLNTAAMTYLPENIRIQIVVESLDGVEAILVRESNQNEFVSHIFD